MDKPLKLDKQYSFKRSNQINTNFLERLFCPNGIGSLPDINEIEIQKLQKKLSKVAMLLEAGVLDSYMEKKENHFELIQLESTLQDLADKIHNLNQQYTPRKSDIMKYYYPYQFDHNELYHMKWEFLGDMVQTISTIYNVTNEKEWSHEDKLSYIQYVSQSMAWLIDEGYLKMVSRDMEESEIEEVLSMKAFCRICENTMILKDFLISNFYRSFAKDIEKNKEQVVK